MIIDLRSDTITKPTPGMMQAMMQAQVGDDVYDEDPTIKLLEARLAAMFGMEAGLFCPSGTMANQIGIKILTQPGDEVICDRLAHIYNYEGGGIAVNSLASVRLLNGDRGRISPEQVAENINADNIHYPRTSLVALENTVNKGGGCYYTLAQIKAIYEVCQANGIALHLDGARVFNALVETGEDPAEYGKYFTTISICLSKGLGTPVGSVLLGSRTLMNKAKRARKVMGGGWRQAGFLAAAGLYALDNNISRLKEDHARARTLAGCLQELPYVETVIPADTNIVIFKLAAGTSTEEFLGYLLKEDIKASAFGPQMVRFVTHLEFTEAMLEKTQQVLKSFAKAAHLA
jgi:threonine aldolase